MYEGDKVIMTFIEEAVIGEFISKVSDSAFDISKVKIKQAVENRKNKHQSPESQMYNIVVDVLNKITYGEYENDQDKIYDAAEKILKGFKSGIGNSEDDIKLGLNDICENVDENKCTDFMKLIYRELSKENYSELYREISLLKGEKESNKTSRIEQKVDVAIQKIDNIGNSSEKKSIVVQEEKFQNNKKDKYIKIWNSRLFLHIDNDENPLTLKDAFIMPDYNRRIQVERIKFSDSDTMGDVIKKFVVYYGTSSMLITGAPGIGKTSITAWIANEYKDDDNIIILRFRDWDSEDLDNGLLKSICNTLKCKKKKLENKILILDGFDEIRAMDNRDFLLNTFFNDILDFDNLKMIITSRSNYIDSHRFHNFFELLPFGIDKISQFYKIIKGVELEKDKIDCGNLNVIGIPVILYMAIMSDTDLTQKATKPELYSRIFAEKGGIFDKFCYEGIGYDVGAQILRDPNNVKIYLRFLQKISFKMFVNDNLIVKIREEDIPELKIQKNNIKILEFPIKNLFEKNVSYIEFIHKTIFEYFLSEYIFMLFIQEDNLEGLAGELAKALKENILSKEVLEFLKFRVRQNHKSNLLYFICNTFQIMLQNGMTFYTGECYRNVVECENKIFSNMLEILHLWGKCDFRFDESICKYIKYGNGYKLNLSGLDFSEFNLSSLDFNNMNMMKINLKNVNLRYADLTGADLTGADLSKAKLFGAKFIETKLVGANFLGAKLNESDLTKADLTGVDLTKIK